METNKQKNYTYINTYYIKCIPSVDPSCEVSPSIRDAPQTQLGLPGPRFYTPDRTLSAAVEKS